MRDRLSALVRSNIFEAYQQPWLLIFFIAQDKAIGRVCPYKFVHILHDKRRQRYPYWPAWKWIRQTIYMSGRRLTLVLESQVVVSTWLIGMLCAQRQGMVDSCPRQHHRGSGHVATLHFPATRTSLVGIANARVRVNISPRV